MPDLTPDPPRRWRLALGVAAAVVAVDAGTKAIAAHLLAGRGVVNVLGGVLHLELYRNHAGPGNTLTGHPVVVSILAAVAVALLAVVAGSARTVTVAVAAGLLLGGGAGNLIDRILGAPGPLRGGVIDWIKPTLSGGSLNLADLSINAAVIVLLIGGLYGWWRSRGRVGEPEPPPAGPA